jgi:hypothetical protein
MYSFSIWPYVRVIGLNVWNFSSSSTQTCPELFSGFEIKEQAVVSLKPFFFFLFFTISIPYFFFHFLLSYLFLSCLVNKQTVWHVVIIFLNLPPKNLALVLIPDSFKYCNRGIHSYLLTIGSTQSYFLKVLDETKLYVVLLHGSLYSVFLFFCLL